MTTPPPNLSNVFELMSDAFVAIDKHWNYTYMNKRAGEIFQRDPAAMVGKNIWEEFPEGVGQPFYHAYYKAMETQQYIYLEEYYPPYDRWFENHIYPSPEVLYIFFQDITDKKRATEKMLKANRLLDFLSQVNQLIVRIPNQSTLFKEICQIAIERGHFKLAWIGLVEEETHRVVPETFAGEGEEYVANLAPISTDPTEPAGLGPTGRALREAHSMVCNDIPCDPQMAPWRELAMKYGYQSSIALPISKFGKLIGALMLYAGSKNFFDKEEVAVLEEAAGDLSFALEVFEKEKLRQKAEALVIASEKRYHTLTEVSPVGIFYTDETGYTTYVNRRWCQITGLSAEQALGYGWLNAVHEEDRERLLHGWREATQLERLSISEYRYIRPNGKVVWVMGQATPERNAKNEVIGYVGTTTDITEQKMADEEIRQMNTELQNLSGYLLRVRDEERRRISREIHDELGQQLTAIKMDVAWINKKISPESGDMKERIEDILQLIDACNRSIRRILTELRPMALDDQDLAEALQWLGKQFTTHTSIPVDFNLEGEQMELAEELSTCIFRICQEALTNITRHADCKHVLLQLLFTKDSIGLIVTDDGLGFDKLAVKNKHSFGLLGMRERVRSLGGEFDIHSSPGNGTKIQVTLPVNPATLEPS